MCAPAGPVDAARLDRGLAVLGQRYAIRLDRDGVLTRSGYLAGADDRRADELNHAIADPDIRAVILARGGYGLTRILDRLDAGALRADPKPIVAFSDGTALLFWALVKAGVRGIHGPMVGQLGELDGGDAEALFELLESPRAGGTIVSGMEQLGRVEPVAHSGALLGGNLCLLSHLIGTDVMCSLRGAVLFIEDIGERPYAVDRYLTHLAATDVMSGAVAAVVGDFEACVETKIAPSPNVFEVVDERLSRFGIGGLRVPGIGHGRANRALPFAARCTVDLASGSLSFDEPAVA